MFWVSVFLYVYFPYIYTATQTKQKHPKPSVLNIYLFVPFKAGLWNSFVMRARSDINENLSGQAICGIKCNGR